VLGAVPAPVLVRRSGGFVAVCKHVCLHLGVISGCVSDWHVCVRGRRFLLALRSLIRLIVAGGFLEG